MPNGSWHYEFIAYPSTEAQQDDNKLRANCFQDKNADKLPSLREPSGRRLANFVRPRASLPRTTKDETAYCCTPIIDSKKNLFEDPEVLLAAELVSCVCVFLASGYDWATVMHEIPISSACWKMRVPVRHLSSSS